MLCCSSLRWSCWVSAGSWLWTVRGAAARSAVRHLVESNSIAVTLGAMFAVLGGGTAILLRALFGERNHGSGVTTSIAVLGTLLAAWFAARFLSGALVRTGDEPATVGLAVARGLADGAKAAWRAPGVIAGFIALLAHKANIRDWTVTDRNS